MAQLNTRWHEGHPMPRNATMAAAAASPRVIPCAFAGPSGIAASAEE